MPKIRYYCWKCNKNWNLNDIPVTQYCRDLDGNILCPECRLKMNHK